jgi:hypothetical protein
MPDPVAIIQSAITTTLPITQYMAYFNTPTPMPGPPIESTPTLTYTFDFMRMMTTSAPFSAFAVQLVGGSVIQYYFGLRIALTALLFVVGFVATRIGININTQPIVVAGRTIGQRAAVGKLPKLPRIPKLVIVLGTIGTLVGGTQTASAYQPAAPVSQVGTTLPGTISYQGVVSVGGTEFDGHGYFKFAIVNSAGSAAYWSNDGTGLVTAPFTPTGHITLTVTGGLFNVALGDTTITGMTKAITETVFTSTGRSLRVWFNDGSTGWQRLQPDTPLTSVPWAIQASNATTLASYSYAAFARLAASNTFTGTTNTFTPVSNSSTSFSVKQADGTELLNIDSTNRVTRFNGDLTVNNGVTGRGAVGVGGVAVNDVQDQVPYTNMDIYGNMLVSRLYDESVTDGAFTLPSSWTYGTGWSHDATNKEADHASGTADLEQALTAGTLTNGEYYRVAFEVRNCSAGSITPKLTGNIGTNAGTSVTSNGRYVEILKLDGTTGQKIHFTPSNTFNGSITNVTVKGLNPNSDGYGLFWRQLGIGTNSISSGATAEVAALSPQIRLSYRPGKTTYYGKLVQGSVSSVSADHYYLVGDPRGGGGTVESYVWYYDSSAYKLGLNTNAPAATLHVKGQAAADVVGIFRGASSQSGSLTEWQNSSGTSLLTVGPTGYVTVTTSNRIYWRDSAIGIYSQADSYLNLYADGAVRVGDSTPTNYTQFDSTGHQTMVGTAQPWDDLRIEPVARTTGSNAPAFEQWFDNSGLGDTGTSRGVYLYSFDDAVEASEKEVFLTIQMPHNWNQSTFYLHVHWIPSSADTTATPRWGFEYNFAEPTTIFGSTVITYATGNIVSEADLVAGKHYITSFAGITPLSSQDGLSSIIIGRLFRNSSNAADTYDVASNKCGLLYIDVHYQLNSLGSTDEYTK